MFRVWNLFLIILAFSLSLIGTFLVRSGVLVSVHTFAADPWRGLYILIFLSVVLVLAFGALIARSGKLRSQVEMESVLSRESAFLFNNLFFLTALATVFLGTLYPLLVETLQFTKTSVGAPYYNAVFVPLALGLFLLMGIGPYIPWRKATREHVKEALLIPTIAAVGAGAILMLVGVRHLYALAALMVVCFTGAAIVSDLAKISTFWAARKAVNPIRGLALALAKNPRRYFGIFTHVGVLVMVVGIIFSTVYQVEKVVLMRPGDDVILEPYRIRLASVAQVQGPNWIGHEGVFDVYQGTRLLATLRPQKRIYTVTQSPTTEAAFHAIKMGHIFLTIPEVSPDGSQVTVRALINPLVLLVWFGGGLMVVGVLLNMVWPRRREVPTVATAREPSDVAPSPLMRPLAPRERGAREA